MSVLGKFDVGDAINVTATFRDEQRNLTDPTGLTFMVMDPNRAVESFANGNAAVTKLGTGTWKLTYTVSKNVPGTWSVRVKGTGGLVVAGEAEFEIRRSAFPSP